MVARGEAELVANKSRAPGWARWFVPAHRWLYHATGGRIGHRLGRQRTLLLTTTGRRSGHARTQPLTYFALEGETVLVASNWGSDQPPAWLLNCLAQPRVQVRLGREKFDAIAHVATEAARARLWPAVTAANPQYARYQAGVTHTIPVVLLRRVPAEP
jgi:deazaflavin-dependent oxidoreductase (nitroreductase family)